MIEEKESINFDDLIEKFKSLLESDEKYLNEVSTMIINRERSLVIDFNDLILNHKELADLLIDSPNLAIDAASNAVKRMVTERDPEYARQVSKFHARFKMPQTDKLSLRKLRSDQIGRFIAIEGIILRQTPPKHFLVKATYRCTQCGFELEVNQTLSSFVQPPRKCPRCGAVNTMELTSERSEFIDWQKVIIQERLEELPSGQLPRNMEAILMDDLVDRVKPGDRVTVTGILELDMSELRKLRPPILSSYINVNYIESMQKDFAEVEITSEDEDKIRELASMQDVRDRIIKSIAPSIYGMTDVKEAIACLLFGGIPKEYPDGIRVRGDVHLLLIGDPGAGKSQLLKFVSKIAPRAVYTNGKGSTAAGLTAAVVRDKTTSEFYLEAGALVLGDMGVAIIDEIDKMDAKDRVAMHEAMEQQTVSIAKAGIVATLNARASVLAAANPTFGRYLPNRTVAENVDLPVTLLSRFDLIFIVRDEPNAEKDRNIATHIVKLHSNDILDAYSRDIIKPDLLRKYIAYARKHVKPILTKEAQELVTQFYVQMSRKSQEPNSPVAITARQLEALIRLAEAEAKMRLSSTVDKEDAERAISLFLKFLQSVGIDVETGKVDIDVIMTGKPRSSQERMAVVLETISKMEELNDGKPVKLEDALREVEERGVDRAAAEKLINMLMKNGELYAPKPGYIKKVH